MLSNYFNSLGYKIFIIYILFQFFIKKTHQNIIHQNNIYKGDATMYGGVINGGSCGFKQLWTLSNNNFKYGVAINSKQYNNSLTCGQCVNIQSDNNKNSINAIITDICPECKYGDLDLFTETYNQLINESPGIKPINWNFINCPDNIVSQNVQLRIDEINYYWLSIQPENFKCGISSIFIYQNNNWIEMSRDDSKMVGLFFIYNHKVEIPFKFKIRNIFFEDIITENYYELKNLFILNKQFSCDNVEKQKEISIDYNSDIKCD